MSHSADRAASTQNRVRIVHPERQHSHELAVALHDAGLLERYIHGAPLPPTVAVSLPAAHRSRMALSRVSRALANRVLPRPAAAHAFYRSMWAFDRVTAFGIGRSRCAAVVAYENTALHTFRAARRAGIGCILDHAGVHHALQDRMFDFTESAEFHRRVVERKDEELALADMILVCSTFAADSFAAAGVPRSKLRVLPLGCDSTAFTPRHGDQHDAGFPVRFLFIGQVGRAKGADLIATAGEKLRAAGVAFSLTIAGALDTADAALLERLRGIATVLDRVPHSALPALHAQADCLVHPSRFDSFAFVVAEALASGLPVIVSDHVGAKDMVADGACGWIVPSEDAEALAQRMLWCAQNRSSLRGMAGAARSTAEAWSWPRYHKQAVAFVDEFLQSWRTGCKLEVMTARSMPPQPPIGTTGPTGFQTLQSSAEVAAC